MGLVLGSAASAAAATGHSPAAPTITKITKTQGIAGYGIKPSATATSLTMRETVKTSTSTCGKGQHSYQPTLVGLYGPSSAPKSAIALVLLSCHNGKPALVGLAIEIGSKLKAFPTSAKVGATFKLAVVITGHRITVKITNPNGTTRSMSGAGGKLRAGIYGMALPNPPHYAPVRFTHCTINGRKLSSAHPAALESVTKSGKVTGKPSKLSNGTAFTIRY